MVMYNSKNEKIMKKIILSIMAVSALFACQKEALVETPQAETVTFTAFVDGADTKTVLNETTKYSEWVAGDKITVHNGTKGFEFATSEAGPSADFSYTGGGFSGNKFLAVYPAGNYTVDIAAKTVNAYIPTWQQAQTGTYHSTAALAVAYSENDAFAFRNATALLKFTVNADNVTHVVFHGNNGEALTGNAKVVLGVNGVDVTCLDTEFTTGEGEEQVKETKKGTWVEMYAYHDADNRYFEKGKTYYIAVAPAALTKGATVKFRINEGEEIVVKTTDKNITIEPNTIYNLGELKYETPVVHPWAVAASFNNWTAEPMTLENGLYVYRNITGLNFTAKDDAEDKSSATGFKFIQDGETWRGGEGQVTVGTWAYIWGSNDSNIYVNGATAETAYDIYLNPEEGDYGKFVIVAAGAAMPEDTPAVETEDTWGVIGDCTGSAWETDIDMAKVNNMFVAYDVVFAKEGSFKIRANKTWDNNDAKNIGLSTTGTVKAGYYYDVIASGGSGNLTVAAGAYDIWFDLANMRVYIMAPDAAPTTAAKGTPEITIPLRTIYLDAKTYWDVDGAVFMSHSWGDSSSSMTQMMNSEGNGIYKCDIALEATKIIFVRKNPANNAVNWEGEWGRIETDIPADKNMFTLTSYSAGEWSVKQ